MVKIINGAVVDVDSLGSLRYKHSCKLRLLYDHVEDYGNYTIGYNNGDKLVEMKSLRYLDMKVFYFDNNCNLEALSVIFDVNDTEAGRNTTVSFSPLDFGGNGMVYGNNFKTYGVLQQDTRIEAAFDRCFELAYKYNWPVSI